jgi:CheY-like chemotaxis protein
MSDARPLMNNFPAGSSVPPRNSLVLVVEDHEESRKMLKVLLGLKGYEVIEAKEGARALELAKDVHPDLVLMDISSPMPEGLAVYREMRNCSSLGDVPIILTSGYSTDAFRQEVQAAGCEEFLVKPLDFDELDRLLESHLHH